MREHDLVDVLPEGEEAALAFGVRLEHGVVRLHPQDVARAVVTSEGFEHLEVFGLLEHACEPDLITRGDNEVLARALHEQYLRSQRALGVDRATNSSVVPWEELPLSVREMNRTQADHIATELEAIGCRIGPLLDIEYEPDALFREGGITPQKILQTEGEKL